MRRRPNGWTLLEALISVTVAGIVASLGVPPLLELAARHELELAARDVVTTLQVARSYAILHGTHVAVRFQSGPQGTVTFALFRDGDGDGVLSRDIESGVDPQAAPPRPLSHFGRRARLGFPPGMRPRDPGDPRRRLDRLDDPIRFQASDLASFSPFGGSTPGSIYLTDGKRQLVVVRVFNRTGHVEVMRYDAEREVWLPD